MPQDPDDLAELYRRQEQLEEMAIEESVRDYRDVMQSVVSLNRGASLRPTQKLLVQWFGPLVGAINMAQSKIVGGDNVVGASVYGGYILLLPPEQLAVITMHEVLNQCLSSTGVGAISHAGTLTRLAVDIGRLVESEVGMQKLKLQDRNLWARLGGGSNIDNRRLRLLTKRTSEALRTERWSPQVVTHIGSVLINSLLSTATVEVDLSSARQLAQSLALELRAGHRGAVPAQEAERFRAGEAQVRSRSAAEEAAPVGGRIFTGSGLPILDGGRAKPGERPLSETERRLVAALQDAGISLLVPGLMEADRRPRQASDTSASGGGGGGGGGLVDSLAEIDLLSVRSGEGLAPSGAALSGSALTPDSVESENKVVLPAFLHTYAVPSSARSELATERSASHLVPGGGGGGGDGKRRGRAPVGVVKALLSTEELFERSIDGYSAAITYPMLVPPEPWRSPRRGGYMKQQVAVMRTKHSALQTNALYEGDLSTVYHGLDVLGSVPWRINQFAYDTLKRIWDEGGGIADVPSREDLPMPQEPDLTGLTEEEAKSELAKWRRQERRLQQKNADRHSLRCDMLLKMKVASMFEGEVMYFPYNLDFRGRVYPIPPHLNHMGADICRGLLTFATGKPLTERGLWWLKVHVANLFGVDKVSFNDRVAFAEECMDKVAAVASDPFSEAGRWWLEADSPWQALVACKELHAAYQLDDPASYVCCLPVHMDGSCNGLQHYAALGRDSGGGQAVNLTYSDKPQDVYSAVLRLVLRHIENDAESPPPPGGVPPPGMDDEEAAAWANRYKCASFVRGSVNRKVVKQTVMTSVYGVTFIGARDQIRARLQEKFADTDMDPDELEEVIDLSSAYLAKTTLASLGEMFTAADQIKDWLTQAARAVSRYDQPMSWITPLGLPVVQPYRRAHQLTVKTLLQQIVLADMSEELPVSGQKQGSAFPPNYVHSLDSTHMFMTCLDCHERGMTFAAVHDSYWTHGCDVDAMQASIRDNFIKLYSQPLLERLRESLLLRFPGLELPPLPPRGDLDLELVRESPYFFS